MSHHTNPAPPPPADLFRLLVGSVTDAALVLLDPAGRVVSWNAGAERLTGFTADAVVGRPVAFWYAAPDAAAGKPDADLRAACHLGRFEEESLRVRADGSPFRAACALTALHDHGRHVGFAVSLRPAPGEHLGTDRVHQAETESRRAAGLLRAVADATTDAVFVKDRDGKYLLFNEAAARFVGKPVAEVLGRDDTALFDPASARRVMDRDRRVMESGRTETEEEVLAAAGVTRTYQAMKAPYRDAAGAVIGLIGVARDVTAHKRAEDALVLFRALIDQTTDGIEVIDPGTGRFLDVNERACRVHGYTRDEYLALRVADIDPLVAARPWAEVAAGLRGPGGRPFESRHRRKDGSTFPVEVRIDHVRLGREYLVAVVRDLTERDRAAEALRRERAFVRLVLDTDPNLIFVKDAEGRFVLVNRALADRYGTTPEALVGRVPGDGVPGPHELPEYRRTEREVLCTGRPAAGDETNTRADGTPRWFHTIKVPLALPDGTTHLLGIAADITDRKRAEDTLRRERAVLRTLIDAIPDLVFTKDTAGRFDLANAALLGFTGAAAQADLAGKTVFDLFPPEQAREHHADDLRVLVSGETVLNREERARDANGRDGWRLVTKAPLRDPDGRVVGLVGVSRNIQERKEAEEALRASEARTRAVIQTALDCIVVIDHAGRVLDFNPAAERTFGYTRDEVLGREMAGLLVPPEHREAHRAGMRHYLATGDGPALGRRLELPALRKGGERFVAELSMSRNPGEPPTFTGFLRDVTDRKRAEEALREERDRFARLAAVAPGALHSFRARPDGTHCFPYASPRVADIYGVPPEALVADASAVWDRVHPDDLGRLRETLAGSARALSVWHCEYRVRHPDRGEIWVEGRSAPAREPDGGVLWHGVLTDVTARKRAEAELDRRRAELELILDTVPALIFFKDRRHRLVRVNRELARLVGLPREAIEGRTDQELGSPHAERYRRDEAEVLATGRPLSGAIEPLHTATGTRWLQTDKLPYRDETGEVAGVVGFAVDVTDRRRAEEALRQAQERLRSVIASSPAVLYTLALAGGRIQGLAWVSENVRGMLGHAPEEATAANWWAEHLHPGDRERVLASTGRDLFATGRASDEYRLRHRAGPYRWVHSETRLVRDGAGAPVEAVGSWSDVTDRKQMEEQFHQAQKMEAVGRLAGGVAHDFNNLLTVINGYADVVLGALPPADPSRAAVTEIRAAGERAAGLTAQLLAFSRKAIIEPKVLDLNDLVSRSATLLQRLIGEDVTLATVLAPALARVKVDPGQIEQVLLNLAVNARDAMPTGGRLTVETRAVTVAPGYATELDVEPGRYVRLAVTDTGTGMTEEVRARVFEPFFTTKEVGQGTGLGLAMVYGAVKTYGGHIGVESTPGAGTTFAILLPALAEVASPSPPDGDRVAPRGTETVLLVEDEPGVRAIAALALTRQGYTVLAAGGGAEAVRVAGQHAGPLDLLVTDVVMPGLSGRAVAEALRAVRGDLKVLYMSGYTDDAVVRHGIVSASASDAFLQKPFTPLSLARKVRAVLDGRA